MKASQRASTSKWSPLTLIILVAAVLNTAVPTHDALADELYWFPGNVVQRLPPGVALDQTPAELSFQLQGRAGLPDKKGTYLLYQHGNLWHWFGPYETERVASSGYLRLQSVIRELRRLNRPRYLASRAVKIESPTDRWIGDIFRSNPNGLRLRDLLRILDGLETIKGVEEKLSAIRSPGDTEELRKELEALRELLRSVSVSTAGDADDASALALAFPGKVFTPSHIADQFRREFVKGLSEQSISANSFESMLSQGALPSELLALARAIEVGAQGLGNANDAAFALSVRNALSGLRSLADSGRRASSAEVAREIDRVGDAVAQSVAKGRGASLPEPGQLTVAELAALRESFALANKPSLVKLVDHTIQETKSSTPSGQVGPKTAAGAFVHDASRLMKAADIARGLELLDKLQVKQPGPMGRLDLRTAALFGLNGLAAQQFAQTLQDVIEQQLREALQAPGLKYIPPGRAKAILDRLQRENPKADALLVEELKQADAKGISDQAGLDRILQRAARSIAKNRISAAVERGLGESSGNEKEEGSPSGEISPPATNQAVGVASNAKSFSDQASEMAEQLLPNPDAQESTDKEPPTLSGGEIAELAGSASDSKGPSGAQDDKSGPENKFGSGSLPLPGSMPVLETVARLLARYFGIDVGYAKQALMLAYMLDPKTFETIARQLEKIHEDLVSADVAKVFNDVNKALAILDQVEAAVGQLGVQLEKLARGGVETKLRLLAEAGVKAFTEQGVAELAKKTNLPVDVVRAMLQKPTSFDSSKAQQILTTVARNEIRKAAISRGLPGDVAAALATGEMTQARALAVAAVKERATAFLLKKGVPESLMKTLGPSGIGRYTELVARDANLSGLQDAFKRDATSALKDWTKQNLSAKYGIPRNLAEELSSGLAPKDVTELTNILERTLRTSAANELVKRGFSEKGARQVLDGGFDARSLASDTLKTAVATRALRGVPDFLVQAISIEGDDGVTALRDLTEAERTSILAQAAVPLSVKDALRSKNVTKAVAAWRKELTETANGDLAATLGIGAEWVSNGFRKLDELDAERPTSLGLTESLKKALPAINAQIDSSGALNEGTPDELRLALAQLIKRDGIGKVSQQLGMDAATLTRFVQATSRVESVRGATRGALSEIRLSAKDRLERARADVAISAAALKRRAKLNEVTDD